MTSSLHLSARFACSEVFYVVDSAFIRSTQRSVSVLVELLWLFKPFLYFNASSGLPINAWPQTSTGLLSMGNFTSLLNEITWI